MSNGTTKLEFDKGDWMIMTIFAIVLITAGIILAAAPNLVYSVTQSWKNSSNSEPSSIYKIMTRVQGIILVIIGVVLVVR